MGWVRIEDDFYDNDKFEAVGPLGMALYVAVLGYCNRNLTDGLVARSKAARLLDFEGLTVADDVAPQHEAKLHDGCYDHVANLLVSVGLWHEEGHDCEDCEQPGPRHFVVHDYLAYQPSKAQVERERAGSRARMAKSRARRSGNVADDVAPQHTGELQECSPAPNPNPKGEEGKPSSRSRTRSATKGTRLPEIFPITPDMAEWGREHAPSVDAPREHEKFLDYWRGQSGQRGVKADWIATWRNWMRRAQERVDERNGHSPSKAADPGLPDWMLA